MCIRDRSTSGVRIGQIRIGTDVSGGTSTIADNYTETTVVGITFSVDIATANTMKLKYTDADNKICKFKYTYQLWNSNLTQHGLNHLVLGSGSGGCFEKVWIQITHTKYVM